MKRDSLVIDPSLHRASSKLAKYWTAVSRRNRCTLYTIRSFTEVSEREHTQVAPQVPSIQIEHQNDWQLLTGAKISLNNEHVITIINGALWMLRIWFACNNLSIVPMLAYCMRSLTKLHQLRRFMAWQTQQCTININEWQLLFVQWLINCVYTSIYIEQIADKT